MAKHLRVSLRPFPPSFIQEWEFRENFIHFSQLRIKKWANSNHSQQDNQSIYVPDCRQLLADNLCMGTNFSFGSLQFGTEPHVKYYLIKWRPLTSSTVDETQNMLVPAGIRPCVKHNSCSSSKSETERKHHIYFGAFSQCALTFCLALGDAFIFEKAED
jgi:hypothetical protein